MIGSSNDGGGVVVAGGGDQNGILLHDAAAEAVVAAGNNRRIGRATLFYPTKKRNCCCFQSIVGYLVLQTMVSPNVLPVLVGGDGRNDRNLQMKKKIVIKCNSEKAASRLLTSIRSKHSVNAVRSPSSSPSRGSRRRIIRELLLLLVCTISKAMMMT